MPRRPHPLVVAMLAALVLLLASPAQARRKKKDAAAPPPPPAATAPVEGQVVPASAAAPPADLAEVVPEGAKADLATASDLYRRGEYADALAAFTRAEAAGARGGLLYYQMGFCQGVLKNSAANVDLKRRAAQYFEASIAAGTDEVDPYYYLSASYLQDLGNQAKGYEVAWKAVEARHAGRFRRDLAGESYFRLGRLYGFAVQARLGAVSSQDPKAVELVRQLASEQVELFRLAVEKMESDPGVNTVYLGLALAEVGGAAHAEGDLAGAISAFGRASDLDPMQEAPGAALNDIAREALAAEDYPTALAAWEAIRGPDDEKTAAQYGIRLVRRAMALGHLPAQFEGKEIASLDKATLERGILATAEALRAPAAAAADPKAPGAQVADQEGLFLALLIAYLNQDHDLRGLVLEHQLVPLVFR